MTNEYIQPDGLFSMAKYGLSHVVTATGNKTIYVSGQVPRDVNGNLVGGNDLEQQMVKALENVRTALKHVSATMQDVVRLEIYLVDYHPEKLTAYTSAMKQFFDPDHLPANTLLGIQSLAFPEYLVEITAVAVIDA